MYIQRATVTLKSVGSGGGRGMRKGGHIHTNEDGAKHIINCIFNLLSCPLQMSGCFVEGGFMAAHLDGKLDSARCHAGLFFLK